MILILHIDDAPSILTAPNRTASHDNALLGPNYSEGDEILDMSIYGPLIFVLFLVVVWVHAEVMECKFFLDSLFEGCSFFEGKRVRFRDYRNNIDDVREFLEDDDVNRFETVRGSDLGLGSIGELYSSDVRMP